MVLVLQTFAGGVLAGTWEQAGRVFCSKSNLNGHCNYV
jgi:hypothetical protein